MGRGDEKAEASRGCAVNVNRVDSARCNRHSPDSRVWVERARSLWSEGSMCFNEMRPDGVGQHRLASSRTALEFIIHRRLHLLGGLTLAAILLGP